MKARLRTHGGVAILAKAHSLRCGLRLALGTKSSLSFFFRYFRAAVLGFAA
jgi:hypothetical protein